MNIVIDDNRQEPFTQLPDSQSDFEIDSQSQIIHDEILNQYSEKTQKIINTSFGNCVIFLGIFFIIVFSTQS